MRQILCTLSVVLLLGCSSEKKDLTSNLTFDGNQVDSIRRANITKSDTTLSLFGGYHLNMTNFQYKTRTKHLIESKELHQFSPTQYTFHIKLDLKDIIIDAEPIPTFNSGKLTQLKLLMWGEDPHMEKALLHMDFDRKYGPSFFSLRSGSYLWIRGNVEIELKSDLVKTDPNLSPMRQNILIYRNTEHSLLGQL